MEYTVSTYSQKKKLPDIYRFLSILSIIGFIVIICWKGRSSAREKVGIFIDGSGSMQGFFPESIREINAKLREIFSRFNLDISSNVFVSSNNRTKLFSLPDFLHEPVWINWFKCTNFAQAL